MIMFGRHRAVPVSLTHYNLRNGLCVKCSKADSLSF